MYENKSPWIDSLHRTRGIKKLKGVVQSDVLIVGGGIAGASTLFYVLKNTNKRVVLLEANLVGHGATGHNAGHIAGGFEDATEIRIKRFGLTKTLEAERILYEGWNLIDEMHEVSGIRKQGKTFFGYGGYTGLDHIVSDIESFCYYYDLAGIPFEMFLIARESGVYEQIPEKYQKYCMRVSHAKILELLDTDNKNYIAAQPHPMGLMNSAQFSEDIISYCLKAYPDRCAVYEHAPVHEILLGREDVRSFGKGFLLHTKYVVLCTNGFSHFKIVNMHGAEINTELHHKVQGLVDYVAGYVSKKEKPPASRFYYEAENDRILKKSGDSAYFYLSRRKWGGTGSLLGLGGVEKELEYHASYNREESIEQGVIDQLSLFMKKVLPEGEALKPDYVWHGLMGYTPSGVRIIGAEPKNTRLLYNLGCNGIGILPSIVGGKKISRHINGEAMKPSIFDPQ